eukprot:6209618-Pleurochrysis_carterae.AAC.5
MFPATKIHADPAQLLSNSCDSVAGMVQGDFDDIENQQNRMIDPASKGLRAKSSVDQMSEDERPCASAGRDFRATDREAYTGAALRPDTSSGDVVPARLEDRSTLAGKTLYGLRNEEYRSSEGGGVKRARHGASGLSGLAVAGSCVESCGSHTSCTHAGPGAAAAITSCRSDADDSRRSSFSVGAHEDAGFALQRLSQSAPELSSRQPCELSGSPEHE